MRWLFAVCMLVVLGPSAADAAKPVERALTAQPMASPGDITPEMWFYEQYQRDYLDPHMAVRRKAEFQTLQRERRLAARRWFGYSAQRPQASCDPMHSDYSAQWSGNNPAYPQRWHGTSPSWVVVRPGDSPRRAY